MSADGADQVGMTHDGVLIDPMQYEEVQSLVADTAHSVETETLDLVLKKIDDLIWRRKIMAKPHDQLDEIRSLVEEL